MKIPLLNIASITRPHELGGPLANPLDSTSLRLPASDTRGYLDDQAFSLGLSHRPYYSLVVSGAPSPWSAASAIADSHELISGGALAVNPGDPVALLAGDTTLDPHLSAGWEYRYYGPRCQNRPDPPSSVVISGDTDLTADVPAWYLSLYGRYPNHDQDLLWLRLGLNWWYLGAHPSGTAPYGSLIVDWKKVIDGPFPAQDALDSITLDYWRTETTDAATTGDWSGSSAAVARE